MSDPLSRAIEQLEKADKLLGDVFSIGIWTKSDDCSDNRERRRGLREVDWAVSDAWRALSSVGVAYPVLQREVDALLTEIRSLVATFEPLPDSITDIMGENPALDVTIMESREKLGVLIARMEKLSRMNHA